jgi:galactokinase
LLPYYTRPAEQSSFPVQAGESHMKHSAVQIPLSVRIESIRSEFRMRFGREPSIVVRAPGRANLLGEHTDYNDGYVLPLAIDRSVLLAAHAREDRRIVVHALDLDDKAELDLDDLSPSRQHSWSNFHGGVAHVLQTRGFVLGGLDVVFTSNVPMGSGLSSSAAVEVAMAFALSSMFNLDASLAELAAVGQEAEHTFVGMPCGIMDQFISALGQKDHALLLDCRDLQYEVVPLPQDVRVVVCDSGVKRELAGSEYRVRRAQCEEAVKLLRAELPSIRALRDVTVDQLRRHSALLPPVNLKRARHVVRSTERMLQAVGWLRRGDSTGFGKAMNACHVSLRDDYEVSCPEADALVEAANEVDGCYGSRITGAGFGGSTVSLVQADAVGEFQQHVRSSYRAHLGRETTIFVCKATNGVGLVWTSE